MLDISNKDIDYGVKKVITFALVNSTRTQEEKVESLNLLAEAVGLEGLKFDHLLCKVKDHYEDEGNIIVGYLMGLFTAERALEK